MHALLALHGLQMQRRLQACVGGTQRLCDVPESQHAPAQPLGVLTRHEQQSCHIAALQTWCPVQNAAESARTARTSEHAEDGRGNVLGRSHGQICLVSPHGLPDQHEGNYQSCLQHNIWWIGLCMPADAHSAAAQNLACPTMRQHLACKLQCNPCTGLSRRQQRPTMGT